MLINVKLTHNFNNNNNMNNNNKINIVNKNLKSKNYIKL